MLLLRARLNGSNCLLHRLFLGIMNEDESESMGTSLRAGENTRAGADGKMKITSPSHLSPRSRSFYLQLIFLQCNKRATKDAGGSGFNLFPTNAGQNSNTSCVWRFNGFDTIQHFLNNDGQVVWKSGKSLSQLKFDSTLTFSKTFSRLSTIDFLYTRYSACKTNRKISNEF